MTISSVNEYNLVSGEIDMMQKFLVHSQMLD